MSQDCMKSRYPWIKRQFSFSDEEIVQLKESSSRIYIQDEVKFPFERVDVDSLKVLDISLKSLLSVDAFQEKKKVFRDKLLNPNQFEETLTEIVIGGLLAQSNIPIRSFEYEYRYDNNPEHHKDLDICALIEGNEVFFEIATRADFFGLSYRLSYKKIPGIREIDNRIHLENIRKKYVDKKKIGQAYKLNFLPAQPIIFVINSLRTLQPISLTNAKLFLGKCELLHSLIMFSGYRIVNNNVKLSQANDGPNPGRIDSIKSKINNETLTELRKNWFSGYQL